MIEETLDRLRPLLWRVPGARQLVRRAIGPLRRIGGALAAVPVIGGHAERLHARLARWRFSGSQYGSFYGVYPSYAAAVADVPLTKPHGYDHDVLAAEYRREYDLDAVRLESYDQPVLSILSELIESDAVSTLVDLGGNLGIHYYTYRARLGFDDSIEWRVVDVPAIAMAGAALARERRAMSLHFMTALAEALPADLLIASGSLAYLTDPLSLFEIPNLPRDLILNRMPLGQRTSFVTLQNGGPVFYAHWVLQRSALLDAAKCAGYECVAKWVDDVDSCTIPLHPELSVERYSGLHLRRQASLR